MDDEDDDDGAPPADARVRVWTNPSGTEILTPDERERFDIAGQQARRRAQLAAAGLAAAGLAGAAEQAMQSTGMTADLRQTQSASSRVLELLVAKFPEFNPGWPPELQIKWFESYEKLLARGAVV